mmetsp:Transcript_17853/g.43703  ORF Transcript_17853/g.43703 Transcript_17853/m.43703 type:complete len:91 (+) Transcript_17853:682-954(+)
MHLDVASNYLGAAGAEALAGAFPATLRCVDDSLDLDNNFLKAAGAAALVAWLLSALQQLDLRDNHLRAAGAEALAGLLPPCGTSISTRTT